MSATHKVWVLRGDKRHPESQEHSIEFPGGSVSVCRTSDGEYWAHIAVNRAHDVIEDATGYHQRRAIVCDGRIDYTRDTIPELSDRPQNIPHIGGVQHIALRIALEVDHAD